MDDYTRLIEKLRKIEALHAGATTPGERDAAAAARQRLTDRLAQTPGPKPDREYKFCLENTWSRRLLIAILRRDGYRPYRYRRQRYTTVMVRLPAPAAQSIWEEFQALDAALCGHLDELASRVIAAAVSPEAGELPLLEGSEAAT
jgi:hypothetical protein